MTDSTLKCPRPPSPKRPSNLTQNRRLPLSNPFDSPNSSPMPSVSPPPPVRPRNQPPPSAVVSTIPPSQPPAKTSSIVSLAKDTEPPASTWTSFSPAKNPKGFIAGSSSRSSGRMKKGDILGNEEDVKKERQTEGALLSIMGEIDEKKVQERMAEREADEEEAQARVAEGEIYIGVSEGRNWTSLSGGWGEEGTMERERRAEGDEELDNLDDARRMEKERETDESRAAKAEVARKMEETSYRYAAMAQARNEQEQKEREESEQVRREVRSRAKSALSSRPVATSHAPSTVVRTGKSSMPLSTVAVRNSTKPPSAEGSPRRPAPRQRSTSPQKYSQSPVKLPSALQPHRPPRQCKPPTAPFSHLGSQAPAACSHTAASAVREAEVKKKIEKRREEEARAVSTQERSISPQKRPISPTKQQSSRRPASPKPSTTPFLYRGVQTPAACSHTAASAARKAEVKERIERMGEAAASRPTSPQKRPITLQKRPQSPIALPSRMGHPVPAAFSHTVASAARVAEAKAKREKKRKEEAACAKVVARQFNPRGLNRSMPGFEMRKGLSTRSKSSPPRTARLRPQVEVERMAKGGTVLKRGGPSQERLDILATPKYGVQKSRSVVRLREGYTASDGGKMAMNKVTERVRNAQAPVGQANKASKIVPSRTGTRLAATTTSITSTASTTPTPPDSHYTSFVFDQSLQSSASSVLPRPPTQPTALFSHCDFTSAHEADFVVISNESSPNTSLEGCSSFRTEVDGEK